MYFFQSEINGRFKSTDVRRAPYLEFIKAIYKQKSEMKKNNVMPPNFYEENIKNLEKAIGACKNDKSEPFNFECAPLVFEEINKKSEF